MKISQVRIQNFRSLRDVTIDFGAITTFVGPNGVGKSTVLRALDWFFSPVSKIGALDDNDVTSGSDGEKIRVEVHFSNLSDEDREALGSYTPADSDSVIVWKTRTPEGREYLSANARLFAPFANIREAGISAAEKKARYNAVRAENTELDLQSANSSAAIDDAMRTFEATHPELLTDADEELQTNFFGFNSNGKMSGLFDYVLITADLRASEESSDAKNSIIGRILERAIDRTMADEEVSRIVETSRREQQEAYKKHFDQPLKDLALRLNRVVETYSPGRSIKVSTTEVELKAPRTTFGVSIADGEVETTIDRQGHGFQRTVLISSLQMLASEGAASEKGVIFLAIEEPELFQHPVQAQAFAKILRSLAEDTGKNIQVAYATHSPYFVDGAHFNEVRRLVRSSPPDREVTIHDCSLATVTKSLEGIVDPEQLKRQLGGVIASKLSTAIFANAVLLVEGTTDQAIFEGLADKRSVGLVEASGVAVVPVGGKANIALPHAILKCLGIPVYAVFDADSGTEDRAIAQGKNEKSVRSDVANNHKMNRKNLQYFKLEEHDIPPAQTDNGVGIMTDNLEVLLDAEWPEWRQSCTEYEEATGEVLAKNQASYRAATYQAAGNPPQQLIDILDKTLSLVTVSAANTTEALVATIDLEATVAAAAA